MSDWDKELLLEKEPMAAYKIATLDVDGKVIDFLTKNERAALIAAKNGSETPKLELCKMCIQKIPSLEPGYIGW